jgi:site-specific DNA-cytosine methylase
MITLAFDRYDFKRKTQYPNGWNIELYKYADTLSNMDYFQIVRNKFKSMILNNGYISPEYKTKKFAQRLLPERWGDKGPSITATSLPDDFVHYAQARVPTVREWARLQTFPDWYQFSGKRTTGKRHLWDYSRS